MRTLIGVAAADPETRQLVRARDQHRLRLVTQLAERLGEQGRLRPGCSIEQAVATLWLLSSFEAFDQLFSGLGLGADAVTARLCELVEHALLSAPPGRA